MWDYQLKVRPYFFKSEKGTLLLAASDDSVRKLQAGTAIDFTGKAVTRKDGKVHIVLGRASPSSKDRGSVTFSIITENGKMVFNSFYHFETNASNQATQRTRHFAKGREVGLGRLAKRRVADLICVRP